MKKIILKKSSNFSSNYKIDYRKELNDGQYQAVMHGNGPALVIAGAGTGKTRTITYRLSRLIEDGVNPQNILLLTFTRKASKEMLKRASLILDQRTEHISGGTFHSFALKVCKSYFVKLNLKQNFSVMDQSDSSDLMDFVRSEFIKNSNFSQIRFPSKSVLYNVYSESINKDLSISEILFEKHKNLIDSVDQIVELIESYRKYKNQNNILDYDDLLLNLNLLLSDEQIKKLISKQFSYIMVDEYQDTNKLQHQIILKLSGNNANVMAVGDDAQSIYSFRGADFNNILFFSASFENCKIYKLEENYRSNDKILNLANQIIYNSEFKYDKKLFSNLFSEEKPYLISCTLENLQSKFIIQQILELSESNYSFNKCAVLYRANQHSFDLELELNIANIPYQKFGGIKFSESAHIKDLLAYLKLIFNQNDFISWRRVMKLIKGIGDASISKFLEIFSNLDFDFEKIYSEKIDIKKVDDIFVFLKVIEKVIKNTNPTVILDAILPYYLYIFEEHYDDIENRKKDIDTFLDIIEKYTDVETLLSDMAIDPVAGVVSDFEDGDDEKQILTLSTIHSAKGLEWDIVFVIWLNDGRFPDFRGINKLESLEEERRLFYVACTRAKSHLYMSYVTNDYNSKDGFILAKPSRFLDNMDDLFEKYILSEEENE